MSAFSEESYFFTFKLPDEHFPKYQAYFSTKQFIFLIAANQKKE